MMDELPMSMIEEAKARDERFRFVDIGFELADQLSGNKPLSVVVSRLRDDLVEAIREFAFVNCGDTISIQSLQARVFRTMIAIDTFNAILTRGRNAEATIRAEDLMASERRPY
jgi:hypothetical protein